MGRSAAARKASAGAPAKNIPSTEAAALPRVAWAVAPLLFGSGFCALVYQIVWQREFRLIFGASTAASAAVIAVFMGGLGLGGRLLGPRADRRANALGFYAALEVGVALSAALTPWLLDLARRAYLSAGGTVLLGTGVGNAARLLLAAIVLAPPTLLAGGTLGAAARAVEHEGDERRRAAALLYGVNTLGAVAGCLAATFWLLEAFGSRATLWIAAALNLGVAAAAGWMAARQPASSGERPPEPHRPDEHPAPARLVLAAACVVGFAFFLLELVWYRMLGPILGGTVYTFGLVLAVALLGIAAGGLVYARAFERRPVGLHVLAATCLLEAAAVALPYALGDRVALLALALRPGAGASLGAYAAGWALVTAVVVLPAAIVAGTQFPLLVALLGRGRARVARHIGRAYFWNTAGGIAGALAGGFGLLPLLTAPGSWRAVALLLAAVGVAAALADRSRRPRAPALAALGSLIVVTLVLAPGPSAVWRHGAIGAGRASAQATAGANARRAWINETRRSVVWESEGVESSVAMQALAGTSLLVNGKVDGNARNDAPTQVMGGLLGALLRPGVQRSLVVGLGTGSTAGWLAALPGSPRVDVVELEPAVLAVARHCGPVNEGAMSDPRVNVVTGDAREVLMAGRGRYDLVFSEPSNPYRAGVASLFTREFYQAVASRLQPDGLFLQWVQAYEVDEETISTVLATMAAVFPEVEVWQVHQIDLVLVGSRRPRPHDGRELRARMREAPFAAALRAAWRATELEDVLARFAAGPALARRLRETGQPLNTDDRNRVEFSFARTLSRSGLFEVSRLRAAAAAMGADRPDVQGAVDWDRVGRQRLAIYTIAGSPARLPEGATEAERRRAEAHAQYLAGQLTAAAATLAGQAEAPEGAVETTLLAEGLADAGDPRAVAHIQALRAVQPTEAEAVTARLALRLGQVDVARDALLSALVHYRTDPWPGQVAMAHALGLTEELARARRDTAPVLFEALGRPFAVNALEELRRLTRLRVASIGGLSDRCHQALAGFEPYVPWREDVLRFRASCYERTRDRRARQARADLEQFLRQEPSRSPAAAAVP